MPALPRLVVLAAATGLCAAPPAGVVTMAVDSALHSMVMEYVEQDENARARGDQVFACGEPVATLRSGGTFIVYVVAEGHGARIERDHVVEGYGSGPGLRLCYGRYVNGAPVLDSLQSSFYKLVNMSDVLPREVYAWYAERYMERQGYERLRELLTAARERCRQRMVAYFGPRLDSARHFDKSPPWNFGHWPPWQRRDAHDHLEDIYRYKNLRTVYDSAAFVPIEPTLGDSCMRNAFGSVEWSPGKRYAVTQLLPSSAPTNAAMILFDRKHGSFYWVTGLGHTYRPDVAEVVWMDGRTLACDMRGGWDRFRKPSRRGTPGDPFGIHCELDCHARKVVWAAPFGYLGFPELRQGVR